MRAEALGMTFLNNGSFDVVASTLSSFLELQGAMMGRHVEVKMASG